MTYGQRQQAMNGIPFYGKGDFNFIATRGPFSSGIAIKVLPLSDLSKIQVSEPDEFEIFIKELSNSFKIGSRISGIKVNSKFVNSNKQPEYIIGKFNGFKIDKADKVIRAFIKDPNSLEIIEVYPDSLNKLNENIDYFAKTFIDFIVQ